jgi:hypothetical protein
LSAVALRDEIQQKQGYENLVRVGAAGGIATPPSALAAFMMGAAYVVTGSIGVQINILAQTSGRLAKPQRFLDRDIFLKVYINQSCAFFS